ncbi:deleted in malignant brain tumors 1 protein-like [Sphaeramia orbicularis]|uniref:deleted in malignant brain tumors 1 protein-like n=1 Tax=Sphaeramia orbicularis TaxID=375764 RepID=UPI00117F91E6|nr:deleted in malignant brain tumors 1 protein-like [Sphaeramia orbicularis]
MFDAAVVCRQLNCGMAHKITTTPKYGHGTGPVWTDQIDCRGQESILSVCPRSSFSNNTCNINSVAGVTCTEGLTVRLVNGNNRCSGRVEVFSGGVWGTVCDTDWTRTKAKVVCELLECGRSAKVPEGAEFLQGTGPVMEATDSCFTNVTSLEQCSVRGFRNSTCGHEKDAGVICAGDPTLRLVNGTDRCSGRVEVLYNGLWGTVCDDGWDIKDVDVVCRAKNCGTALKAKSSAFFGEGQGPIWLSDVNCFGNESSLSDCGRILFGRSSCDHSEDAGVVCSASIRLVNGTDRCSGRVEVYHDDQWLPALNFNWGMNEATVVCREMNCGDAAQFSGSSSQVEELRGYKVSCTSTESSLTQCTLTEYVRTSSDHMNDASVVCSGIVKLAGGPNRCVGRVELYDKGQWGAVCGDSWDMFDAAVVCRELNCGMAHKITTTPKYGHGTGPVWTDQIDCRGQESILSVCPRSSFSNNTCNINSVAGVTCTEGLTVRLVNGNNRCSGRVEVFSGGVWGTICDTDWTRTKAKVVCELLECGRSAKVPEGAEFLQGTGPVMEATDSCFTNVTSLEQCSVRGFRNSTCGHEKDAGVVCAGDPTLRLVNGTDRCSGRVEVLYNGLWGTVCDDGWDIKDVDVVCRAKNCGTALKAKSSAFFGEGQGPIWLDDVECFGNESSLSHCGRIFFERTGCDHNEDAAVVCSASIRLVNGTDRCSGRVEVYHDDQWLPALNFNWGINQTTVVCKEINCGDPVQFSGSLSQVGDLRGYKVSCTGTESSLTQCTLTEYVRTSSDRMNDASVVCSGIVKLAGGPNRCVGRVELYDKGQWGAVCGDSWDMFDAAVVCRQLNCGIAHKITTTPKYGHGTGPVWTDQIDCRGQESILSVCPRSSFSNNTCNINSVAGITCTEGLTVRLVNGNNRCSGRVEVFSGGVWGTVCDTDWTRTKAKVVCELLECGRSAKFPEGAEFLQGTGPVMEATDSCFTNVASLEQCSVRGFRNSTCGHEKDAGVICAGDPTLRLVNGTDRCSGRVEVLYNGLWGTVCDDGWDIKDVDVVCRAKNCGTALKAKSSAFFGEGQGPIWLDDVECFGNESSLSHCGRILFGRSDCGHSEDAGVVCSASIRLVNGTDRCSGRVEVYHDDQWLSALNFNWGMNEATVVCKEMNCGEAVQFSGSSSQVGDLRGYKVSCTGTESSLTQCTLTEYVRTSSDHMNDASVVCSGIVKLAGGPNRCVGRVALYDKGQWGAVCGDSWDMFDAAVVCRQLNCGIAHKITTTPKYGHGTGPVWTDQIDCRGQESILSVCPRSSFSNNTCNINSVAGVTCTEGLPVRLVSGNNRCSGRVEVFSGGVWGTVCDTDWTRTKAKVVCELLECGRSAKVPEGAEFLQGTGPVMEATDSCFTNVTSLEQCSVRGFRNSTCGHEKDAGVVCAGDPTLRLVNGTDRCSGRVEVLYNGLWGTVCDDGWDIKDVDVVCRAKNCGTALKAKSSAFFGEGQGPIWLDDVNCFGNESSLSHCGRIFFERTGCDHREDAGVVCSASIRLVNGTDRCSGRVEVYHDDQWLPALNFNWGMNEATVVCREMNCGDAAQFSGSSSQVEELRGYKVSCTGTESSLTQCTLTEYVRTSSDHMNDASVVCSGKISDILDR